MKEIGIGGDGSLLLLLLLTYVVIIDGNILFYFHKISMNINIFFLLLGCFCCFSCEV